MPKIKFYEMDPRKINFNKMGSNNFYFSACGRKYFTRVTSIKLLIFCAKFEGMTQTIFYFPTYCLKPFTDHLETGF